MDGKRVLFYGLIVALVLAAGCVGQKSETQKPSETPSKPEQKIVEIPIGVLVDISGPLATHGEDIKLCTEIARDNINKYFESKGEPYRVKLYIEDTKADQKLCLEKVMNLYAKGIKMAVGPMASGEVKNIFEYVTSNKMIIISPSSTAAPKYIGVTNPEEKKYVFRFVATDAFQTKAIAKVAQDLGIKAVVITYIGNAWGKGLDEYGKAEFEKAGITVAQEVEYPDPPPSDFTPYIATLESKVNELLQTYKPEEIAVEAFSYEEVATILAQVKEDSPLLKVRWLGCDGITKSEKVVSDAPQKASMVGLYSTIAEIRGKGFQELNKTYYAKTGGTPKSYGMNAYDATWVLALAYAQVGSYDADKIAAAIKSVAEKYSKGEYGVLPVSGDIELDEYNDRVVPEYKIYAVKDGKWTEMGTWKYATNEITWVEERSTPKAGESC